jgi:hypothetical protein
VRKVYGRGRQGGREEGMLKEGVWGKWNLYKGFLPLPQLMSREREGACSSGIPCDRACAGEGEGERGGGQYGRHKGKETQPKEVEEGKWWTRTERRNARTEGQTERTERKEGVEKEGRGREGRKEG